MYMFVACYFFWEIRDSHWIVNTFFMYGSWKSIPLNIRSASQIVQKLPGELKYQGKLIY